MRISILIPSKRPDGLEKFVHSLISNCESMNNIDIILALDVEKLTEPSRLPIPHTIVYCKVGQPITHYFESAYKASHNDWNFFANDDLICETKRWDSFFFGNIDGMNKNPEKLLLWPDDKLFGPQLACFPLVHRSVTDKLFPLPPFRRFKVDDSIMDVVPERRRKFIGNVVMRHNNLNTDGNYGGIGDPNGDSDHALYVADTPRRASIREQLELKVQ